MAVQRKIFISYRQADNPDFVDRIRDRLIAKYSDDNVFMDFVSIPAGVQFADYIRDSVRKCDAVIAIIGPRWVELFKDKAARFQEDYVRIELGLALELGKPILPICIVGAQLPSVSDLPPELRPILKYNAAFLERTNFHERIERIIAGMEATLGSTSEVLAELGKPSNDPFSIFSAEFLNMTATEVAEAYQVKGKSRISKQERDGMIDSFSESIRLDPQNPRGYHMRGLARDLNGDPEGALADYQKYLALGAGQEDEERAKVEGYIRGLKKKLGLEP